MGKLFPVSCGILCCHFLAVVTERIADFDRRSSSSALLLRFVAQVGLGHGNQISTFSGGVDGVRGLSILAKFPMLAPWLARLGRPWVWARCAPPWLRAGPLSLVSYHPYIKRPKKASPGGGAEKARSRSKEGTANRSQFSDRRFTSLCPAAAEDL